MKTVNIKGKDYVEVVERLKEFRNNPKYENYNLNTEIVELKDGVCVIKCEISQTYFDKDSYPHTKVVSSGIAYEKEGSSFINKTSYIENCETSAIGRALGNLGIGIDTSVASYEEVANAIKQQENKPTHEEMKQKLLDFEKPLEDYTKVYEYFKVQTIDEMTVEQMMTVYNKWNK